MARGAPSKAKRKLFVLEYLIDLNATQAAIRCGMSKTYMGASKAGSEMMKDPDVAFEIEAALEKRSIKTEMDAEFVLIKARTIMERCMQEEEVMQFNYSTKQMEGTGEYKFNAAGALKALELIGRHLKMFTDKVEHSGTVDLKGMSREQMIEEIKAIDAEMEK